MPDTPRSLTTPISNETIHTLHVGDSVLLNGTIVTGRDAAHKWLYDYFIAKTITPSLQDNSIYEVLVSLLKGSILYHCGPVVSGVDTGDYHFVSAGPTTSVREEPYQGEIMRHFDLKGVIGKGGMGEKTLAACVDTPAVYLHAVGGAAALIARSVEEVLGVYKLEFGIPEAMWVIQVREFPVVVTMDASGRSLHKEVEQRSQNILQKLI